MRPRPRFDLEIWQTDWRHWPLFEPHHYLKVPRMVAAKCYVGTVDEEPVCHLAVSTKNVGKGVEARACRLVVMPEWQGAGVGLRLASAKFRAYSSVGPTVRNRAMPTAGAPIPSITMRVAASCRRTHPDGAGTPRGSRTPRRGP